MPTEFLQVDPKSPNPAAIRRAADLLRQGKLVAFPTETVYGLGADGLEEEAVRRIFAAKGRPANNPLILHVKDVTEAQGLAQAWPTQAQILAEAFWPGSLTLVVPRSGQIPDVVTAGGPTVALRVPAHPVALALIEAAGRAIAAPSANRSNQLSPTTAQHVLQDLADRVDLILDGGPAWGGLESTVLDVTTDPPRILRPGLITPAQLEEMIGPITRPNLPLDENTNEALRSPGMGHKHYAPRARLECVSANESRRRVESLTVQGIRVGWLTFSAEEVPTSGVVRLFLPLEPKAYSAQLYAALHRLDAARVERIVVDAPPDTEEWLAVRDRLSRAGG